MAMCMCSWAASEVLRQYDPSKSKVTLLASDGSAIRVTSQGPAESDLTRVGLGASDPDEPAPATAQGQAP